ncbi:MAG: acetate--CoA ligase family protein, partial [Syntrophobacteraceae bacterium]|nr:acetate--CoA ligase family protein [Syntrophobacteraceae bacterium]
MSIFNLDRVFKPISVAVIGATDEKESSGCAVVRNLMRDGYEGRLFPVNPDIDKVLGLACRGGLQEIEEAVDLAVIAAPLDALPCVMEQCALKGVGGAIVLSSGSAMAGAEGVPTGQRVWETAYKAGIRIVGPRSCGLISPGAGLNASTLNHMALPGGLALVSQSRSLLAAILDLSLQEGIGFSHLVSVGDMVDIDFGDLVNYLGNDPEVTGIALYVEHLTNVRKFMSAARAVSRVKPIVVLKGTGSSGGDWTTTSHGADWAGRDAVYDAAFRRAGVVRVRTVEELLECPELMARQPRPSGAGLAIITNSRGLGLMAADALVEFGLAPARLQEETIDRLKRVLPESWNQENPVDIGDNATADRTREAADICMNAPEVNGALIIHSPVSSTDPAALAGSVADIQLRKRVPVLTVWMGGKDVEKGREVLKKAGIPTYASPERAVRSFVTMVGHARNLETLREIPPKLPGDLRFNRVLAREIIEEGLKGKRRRLNELDAMGLLAAYGIPVPPIAVARSEEEASREAATMGYPVVVKIHSHDIVHKSEADCVMLRLRNETEVRQAFRHAVDNALLHAPEAEILGVTVQPMITGEGVELILGGKRDELFGPVILFGMGGPARELLDGVAVALPPLNRLLARRLMEETRVTRLLEGH